MKKSDFAMIILIASVCIGVSYFIVGAIPFLKAPDKPKNVPTIEAYKVDVAEPNPAVFNDKAENPTIDVTIGGSTDSSTE